MEDKKVHSKVPYSKEDREKLIKLYANTTNNELALLLNRSHDSIASAAFKLGLKKSRQHMVENGRKAVLHPYLSDESKARALSSRFKKGCKPWTTGIKLSEEHKAKITGMFKKGRMPHNTLEDGSYVRMDGVLHIKLGYKNWKSIARIRWEEVHGPIPEGMLMFRLDGNKQNDDISNLCIINRKDLVLLNRNHAQLPQELKELQILINKIKRKTSEANKG